MGFNRVLMGFNRVSLGPGGPEALVTAEAPGSSARPVPSRSASARSGAEGSLRAP